MKKINTSDLFSPKNYQYGSFPQHLKNNIYNKTIYSKKYWFLEKIKFYWLVLNSIIFFSLIWFFIMLFNLDYNLNNNISSNDFSFKSLSHIEFDGYDINDEYLDLLSDNLYEELTEWVSNNIMSARWFSSDTNETNDIYVESYPYLDDYLDNYSNWDNLLDDDYIDIDKTTNRLEISLSSVDDKKYSYKNNISNLFSFFSNTNVQYSCVTWFDWCNICWVENNGEIWFCTEMYCEFNKPSFCVDFSDWSNIYIQFILNNDRKYLLILILFIFVFSFIIFLFYLFKFINHLLFKSYK